MTVVYGCPKNKAIQESRMRYLKRKEIIIWKEDILHLEILCQGMLQAVQLKKDVMQVMVLVHQSKLFTWIIVTLLNVTGKWKQVKKVFTMQMKPPLLN